MPTENLRFRDESLVFRVAESATEEEVKRMRHYEYPAMTKTLGDFKLNVSAGSFTDSEIVVLLGENGTGKTTLIRLMAGSLSPDSGSGKLFRNDGGGKCDKKGVVVVSAQPRFTFSLHFHIKTRVFCPSMRVSLIKVAVVERTERGWHVKMKAGEK